MIRNVSCPDCGRSYTVEETANTMVFCPLCRKMIFLTCEAGYGPVTPCYLYIGEEPAGSVVNEDGKYVLKSLYLSKVIPLQQRYLQALYETQGIVEAYLKEEG